MKKQVLFLKKNVRILIMLMLFIIFIVTLIIYGVSYYFFQKYFLNEVKQIIILDIQVFVILMTLFYFFFGEQEFFNLSWFFYFLLFDFIIEGVLYYIFLKDILFTNKKTNITTEEQELKDKLNIERKKIELEIQEMEKSNINIKEIGAKKYLLFGIIKKIKEIEKKNKNN